MIRYSANLEGLRGKSVLTARAQDVPRSLWRVIQSTQEDIIRRQIAQAMPRDIEPQAARARLNRASRITDEGDVESYADKRVRPNHYRGENGTNLRQLYGDPRVTLVFNREEEDGFAGSVGFARNTSPSGSIPRRRDDVEQWLKMQAGPSVPIVGGHRYEKISDIVFVDEPTAAILGIHHALQRLPRRDHVSMYHVPNDAADTEVGWAIETLGLQYTGSRRVNPIYGYPGVTALDRYEEQVGSVLEHIEALPGALDAIEDTQTLRAIPTRWRR